MRISFNQRFEKTRNVNGFGYAREMCESALVKLGHEVRFADPLAEVEINFIQPEHWLWSGDAYRIGYLPWESTELKPGWLDIINNDIDELWTPSPVMAEWLVATGVQKPVRVYLHGVDGIWSPRLRHWSTPFQLFHHGGDAVRKGLREAFTVFEEVFQPIGAEFNEKMNLLGFNVPIPGMNQLSGYLTTQELVELYHNQHLMVYPSWGEGFGLAPLQAMATAMPVLITKGWAPYEYLLEDDMLIETELVESPWQIPHPGKMLKPNIEDLIEKAKKFADEDYYNQAAMRMMSYNAQIMGDFDWINVTQKAFEHLL